MVRLEDCRQCWLLNALDNFNGEGATRRFRCNESALNEGWLISGRSYAAIAFQIAVTDQQRLENSAALYGVVWLTVEAVPYQRLVIIEDTGELHCSSPPAEHSCVPSITSI